MWHDWRAKVHPVEVDSQVRWGELFRPAGPGGFGVTGGVVMTWPKFSKGVRKKSGMNKLEARYARHLDDQKNLGIIFWWRYEGIKLRLSDGAFFTPDFFVMMADGEMQVHETKGFMREAANVRLKIAAELFPFRFILVKADRLGFTKLEIGHHIQSQGDTLK